MNNKVYTQRKYDTDNVKAGAGVRYIQDSASTFYSQLAEVCGADVSLERKYDVMRNVFARVVDQSILNCRIVLVGLFSKVDYCIKDKHVPDAVAQFIHYTRRELFPDAGHRIRLTDEMRLKAWQHNLKATALLVHWMCGKEEIPESLQRHFPKADRKVQWGKFSEKVLRVIVERWDEEYIWATAEENASTLKVCYGAANRYLTREGRESWEYLQEILWEGAVLNLVRIRMDEKGEVCLPELIILEPDYLINITTIASCFESYAESPFVNLVNKIKPSPNSVPIHLGNLSGQLLDNTIHGRDIPFDESFKDFVNQNSLSLISCKEFIQGVAQFKSDGQLQKNNIEKLINHDLPESIEGYDRKAAILEPSFFSPTLGIQGRFDLLEEQKGETRDRVIIIEQKSGKSEYNPMARPMDPPRPKEQHTVQALLYRALYQYEITKVKDSDKQLDALDITPMLLYSRYPNGLLQIGAMPSLFLRAMRIRNLLAWSEYLYANEGLDVLTTLTPDNLNKKHSSGKFWENYTRPQLQELLAPIHAASPLERAYYLRFLRFLEKELLLSKVGNKMKENSGFASIWHDTLEEKKAAGNIYDRLVMVDYSPMDGPVSCVTLRFLEPHLADTSNFRIGDIVILYPYKEGEVPDACAQMVNRAGIVDIKENTIELRLRNRQTDSRVFHRPDGTLWAIEHDMFESSTGSLYAAMHAFLSAPKRRRDLVLSQRHPEIDDSIKIRGDYDNFNELALRAKQAKDLFLIIGPPGTGKTSYGLVNLLKEELLEENSNILLLSYTNRAVDEICSKLLEIKEEDPTFDFIRIGSDLSCAPDYHEHLLSTRCAAAASGNEVNRMIRECRVFCGTTSALNGSMSLFELKHFSLAIVDESSQILEPHLIGLLSACKDGEEAIDKFVLIGDHKQLPAVVQQLPEESVVTEPELLAINLRDCRLSLFERLLMQFRTDDGYDPRYVYMLTRQGRMHRDIAAFPNIAFYNDRLDIVPLEHQELPSVVAETDHGIVRMLTSSRIAFVASESPRLAPSAKTNSVEADMIAATVMQIYELNKSSFSVDKTIGIIVPYRNQISTVRNAIDRYGIPVLHNITIDTVERYQGSQRDYIIYGFTIHQSYQLNFLINNSFVENGVTIDRKLNVAMTRARLNLVMIGNPALLQRVPVFHHLMDYVKSNGAYVEVSAEKYCKGEF